MNIISNGGYTWVESVVYLRGQNRKLATYQLDGETLEDMVNRHMENLGSVEEIDQANLEMMRNILISDCYSTEEKALAKSWLSKHN